MLVWGLRDTRSNNVDSALLNTLRVVSVLSKEIYASFNNRHTRLCCDKISDSVMQDGELVSCCYHLIIFTDMDG